MNGKLNIVASKLQLMIMCLTGEAMHLIVDCDVVRHAMNTVSLVAHDLNKFHPLIDRSNLHGIEHPDFAICERKNLSYDKLDSITTHVLVLGM